MNAVIYARYSSDKQTEQSIEGQLRECHAYAQRCGYQVIGEYIDRAISGTSDRRPEFQRMIADSTKRKFSYIIVWKLDRFSRNRYDSAIYKAKLKKNGVRVVSVTEGVGEGNESIIMEAMLEAMAEVYSKQIGENASRGMRETAIKGLCTGGQIPLGYVIGDDGFLRINETEAEAVKVIYQMYADGQTKTQISNWLNDRGFKTKQGNIFRISSVDHILKNRMYIGDYTYKGEIARSCPQIVDNNLFAQCQEKLEASKRAYGRKASVIDDNNFLLFGKLFCGYCGSSLAGDSGTSGSGVRHSYYTCSKRKNYRRNRAEKCIKKSERKDFIEWYVCEQTVEYVLNPNRLDIISEKIVEEYNKQFNTAAITDAKSRLKELDKEFDSIADSLIKTTSQSVIDKLNHRAEELELLKAELEDEIKTLQSACKVKLSKDEVMTWLKKYCAGDLMDKEFRQRIIDTFINAIYLYDDKITIYYNVKDSKQISYIDHIKAIDGLFDDFEHCSCSVSNGEP